MGHTPYHGLTLSHLGHVMAILFATLNFNYVMVLPYRTFALNIKCSNIDLNVLGVWKKKFKNLFVNFIPGYYEE